MGFCELLGYEGGCKYGEMVGGELFLFSPGSRSGLVRRIWRMVRSGEVGWKGASGGVVVIYNGVSRVCYDVVNFDTSMVVVWGMPCMVVGVKVSCNDIVKVMLSEESSSSIVVYVSCGGFGR